MMNFRAVCLLYVIRYLCLKFPLQHLFSQRAEIDLRCLILPRIAIANFAVLFFFFYFFFYLFSYYSRSVFGGVFLLQLQKQKQIQNPDTLGGGGDQFLVRSSFKANSSFHFHPQHQQSLKGACLVQIR